MAKLSIVFCIVLAFSVALAFDPQLKKQEKAALAVKNCIKSINRIFTEVARKYEKTVKSSNDKELRDTAFAYYAAAGRSLNEFNAEVRNSKEPINMTFVLKTFGNNDILCSNDMAVKLYERYYWAWDGMDQLAKSAGQQ